MVAGQELRPWAFGSSPDPDDESVKVMFASLPLDGGFQPGAPVAASHVSGQLARDRCCLSSRASSSRSAASSGCYRRADRRAASSSLRVCLYVLAPSRAARIARIASVVVAGPTTFRKPAIALRRRPAPKAGGDFFPISCYCFAGRAHQARRSSSALTSRSNNTRPIICFFPPSARPAHAPRRTRRRTRPSTP
jgi:hypothetical protein